MRTLSLGDQLRQYAGVVGRRVDYVHRNLAIMLFTAIVYDTPVDTGAARGSWYPSLENPVMGGPPRIDPTGTKVVQEIQAVCMGSKVSQVLFLMNTVHYINDLEYGWSKKAPEGMVRINVARVRAMVTRIIAQAKEVT